MGMIMTETITIKDKEYKRTYSDSGYMIERNGEVYEEAIDPLNTDREYVETDVLIESAEICADTENEEVM
jgi:hypothetical protein